MAIKIPVVSNDSTNTSSRIIADDSIKTEPVVLFEESDSTAIDNESDYTAIFGLETEQRSVDDELAEMDSISKSKRPPVVIEVDDDSQDIQKEISKKKKLLQKIKSRLESGTITYGEYCTDIGKGAYKAGLYGLGGFIGGKILSFLGRASASVVQRALDFGSNGPIMKIATSFVNGTYFGGKAIKWGGLALAIGSVGYALYKTIAGTDAEEQDEIRTAYKEKYLQVSEEIRALEASL